MARPGRDLTFQSVPCQPYGQRCSGRALPNALDFFWDGQGTGNCWGTAYGDAVEPMAIPRCPGGSQPRIIADPNKLVLFVQCSNYELATQTLPAGCDWFDTPARPGTLAASISIQSVFPAIQFGAVLLLMTWLLRGMGPPRPLALGAAAAAGLGTILLLLASVEQFYYLNAPGIAMLGIGWLAAVPLMPTRRLAVLTLLLGVAALLEAVDTGIVLLPSPVGPVWVRLALEVAWIAWTARSLIRAARTKHRPLAS